jgi:type VI secretion system secreted protein VgrG
MGFPTVIIGNMPASRIGDMHACPQVTVVVPHFGGPFILGSFTVLTGFSPQSRVGDVLICVGPPDALAMGCPTVMVGMAGGGMGFGALMMGLALGLKNFLGAYPRAVMQNGAVVTQYNEFITIEGTPQFQAKAVRDLNLIAATPSGKKLLSSMKASGKHLRIHIDAPPGTPGNWAWTDPPPAAGSGAHPPGYLGADGKPGPAADAQVGYNPDRVSLSGPPGSPYSTANWAQSPNRPADVGLFHEMVHSDDIMQGKLDNTPGANVGPMAGTPIADSELRAAGLPPHAAEDYSENTYRSDRGLPNRTFY